MSVLTGLAAINKILDQQGGSKNNWFKLKDGESAKVWFLQELDESHESYNPEYGTALIIVEHSHPTLYLNKAQCTIESGSCWACEQVAVDKKWRARGRLYINVLVERGDERDVAILSQGISGKAITQTLVQYAEEAQTIMADAFRIRRNGSEVQNTAYTLIPVPRSSGEDPSQYKLYDLQELVPVIEYDKQEEFYTKDARNKQEKPKAAVVEEPERAAMDW